MVRPYPLNGFFYTMEFLKAELDNIFKENGKGTGSNIAYHCPSCHHRKQKLVYNIDNHMFHCWVCDFKGKGLHKIFNLLSTPQSTRELYYKQVGYLKQPSVPIESLRTVLFNKLYGDDDDDYNY